MTPEQRLDRLERVAKLFVRAGLRARQESREQKEKINILIDMHIRNEEAWRAESNAANDQLKILGERFAKTEELINKLGERSAKTDEQITKLNERGAKTDEQIKDLAVGQAKTDKALRGFIESLRKGRNGRSSK